jgi:ABC-2 type transport system permease protein
VSALALTFTSYRAEWLKLARRPATWILGIILVAGIFSLGYGFLFLAIQLVERSPATPQNPNPGSAAQILREGLLPSAVVAQVIPLLSTIGGPIALILGALTIGSEYSWGTLKTILTQRPGRLSLTGGKFLALAPILLAFSFGALVVGLIGSLLYAAIAGASFALPSAATLIEGLGAGWLILAAWTTLGVALATLFRSAALAIGLGLVYALVLENVISGVAFFVEQAEAVRRLLLGANSSALANYFADPTPGSVAAQGRIPPERATLILLVYIAAFLAVTLFVMNRRDVV